MKKKTLQICRNNLLWSLQQRTTTKQHLEAFKTNIHDDNIYACSKIADIWKIVLLSWAKRKAELLLYIRIQVDWYRMAIC